MTPLNRTLKAVLPLSVLALAIESAWATPVSCTPFGDACLYSARIIATRDAGDQSKYILTIDTSQSFRSDESKVSFTESFFDEPSPSNEDEVYVYQGSGGDGTLHFMASDEIYRRTMSAMEVASIDNLFFPPTAGSVNRIFTMPIEIAFRDMALRMGNTQSVNGLSVDNSWIIHG